MIGIIAAMKSEIQAIKDSLNEVTVETYSGIEFCLGTLDGKDVIVAQCGVGKVFAAMCAQTMILKYNPDIIINTGVGGSLSDELSIGDIAISNEVLQHDMDTSAVGDPIGMVSGVNMIYFPANENAYRLIKSCADKLSIHSVIGRIASGDQFIASKEKKDNIVGNFNAIACELEGAAIGQVAYVNNVPFCVVRAISDSADNSSHMDYNEFLKIASERSYSVIREFVKTYK